MVRLPFIWISSNFLSCASDKLESWLWGQIPVAIPASPSRWSCNLHWSRGSFVEAQRNRYRHLNREPWLQAKFGFAVFVWHVLFLTDPARPFATMLQSVQPIHRWAIFGTGPRSDQLQCVPSLSLPVTVHGPDVPGFVLLEWFLTLYPFDSRERRLPSCSCTVPDYWTVENWW